MKPSPYIPIKTIFGTCVLVMVLCTFVMAQDPRERKYMYPVLDPHHDSKPKIEGFAVNKITEHLDRGVIVSIDTIGNSYISWRYLNSDTEITGFNLYKISNANTKTKLNQTPVTKTTDLILQNQISNNEKIEIVPVINNKENSNNALASKPTLIEEKGYVSVKLKGNYMPNRIALADLNGDGKAEIAVKTSVEKSRDYNGRITSGPEYISIWDGMTGEEICKDDWPERAARLGDYNRNNRNQIGLAFLDGKTPCLLIARGTYRLMVLDAFQFHDNKLEKLWHWDGDGENPIFDTKELMECIVPMLTTI